MQSVSPMEIGVMMWAGRDSLAGMKALGVRCGQLGIAGEYDLSRAAEAWKADLARMNTMDAERALQQKANTWFMDQFQRKINMPRTTDVQHVYGQVMRECVSYFTAPNCRSAKKVTKQYFQRKLRHDPYYFEELQKGQKMLP